MLEAAPPVIDEQGRFALRDLRHPLLAVDEAVPNDVDSGCVWTRGRRRRRKKRRLSP